MRRLILSLMILVLSFGVSYGLSFRAEKTGSGTTTGIYVNEAFVIEIWADFVGDDTLRITWSTPFRFYGTDSVTTLTSAGVFVNNTTFDGYWTMMLFHPNNNSLCLESWDGDLTNNAGGLTGDQFNYSGTNLSPPLPSSGSMRVFYVEFAGIVGGDSASGTFCVDSGDFVNNTFDWLLDSPSPAFGPVCWDVTGGPAAIGDYNDDILPKEFSLSQNRPNPFNPTTIIDFALPTRTNVSINIYNVLGQKVKTLVNTDFDAGYHKETWDGTTQNGMAASSGIYFYKIIAGEFTDTKKMILLK